MPCSCQGSQNYVATRPDGSQATYNSQSAAAADVRRNGGSYVTVPA